VAGKAVLLVLAVSEPGLRSALAAQLSLAAIDLVTAHEVDGPVLRRSVRRPAVLVIDEQTVLSRPAEWLEALLIEPYWRQILVLCEKVAGAAGARDSRLQYLAQDRAREAIAELIPQWLTEDGV
jgi:hypothetical protein